MIYGPNASKVVDPADFSEQRQFQHVATETCQVLAMHVMHPGVKSGVGNSNTYQAGWWFVPECVAKGSRFKLWGAGG